YENERGSERRARNGEYVIQQEYTAYEREDELKPDISSQPGDDGFASSFQHNRDLVLTPGLVEVAFLPDVFQVVEFHRSGCHKFAQALPYAVHPDAYIVLGNAHSFSDFVVGYLFQRHQDHSAVNFGELPYGPLEPLQVFLLVGVRSLRNIQVAVVNVFGRGLSIFFPQSGDGGVKGDPVHPGGDLRLAPDCWK